MNEFHKQVSKKKDVSQAGPDYALVAVLRHASVANDCSIARRIREGANAILVSVIQAGSLRQSIAVDILAGLQYGSSAM